jgi:hypothetical protein
VDFLPELNLNALRQAFSKALKASKRLIMLRGFLLNKFNF